MEKEEVYNRIMEDPQVKEALQAIRKLRDGYGEHGDNVLGFIIGALSNLFENPSEAVYGFEVIKANMILRDLGLSGEYMAKVARERKPSAMRPA